ncbi:MAG: hypothetical protein ABGX16_24775 [Pirellulales bacterium]
MRQFTFLFLRFMVSFFKSKTILQAENPTALAVECGRGRVIVAAMAWIFGKYRGPEEMQETVLQAQKKLLFAWLRWLGAGKASNRGQEYAYPRCIMPQESLETPIATFLFIPHFRHHHAHRFTRQRS